MGVPLRTGKIMIYEPPLLNISVMIIINNISNNSCAILLVINEQ